MERCPRLIDVVLFFIVRIDLHAALISAELPIAFPALQPPFDTCEFASRFAIAKRIERESNDGLLGQGYRQLHTSIIEGYNEGSQE